MKSPFPGMDPYLEIRWRDIHLTLVVHASGVLNRRLPIDLRSRVNERRFAEFSSHLHSADDRMCQRFIEVIDIACGGKVVTNIEFVSPTNKRPGEGRELYLRRQQEMISAEVNLVEIDLTRSGRRELTMPEDEMPAAARTTYIACVRHGSNRRRFEVYPMPLRNRLRAIRIPLRPTDPDAAIDLQVLVDLDYEEGRHDDIDYSVATMPPLTGEDEAWADQLLRDAGKR